MKIKFGHPNFAGAVIHYILLNKLNSFGKNYKDSPHIYEYSVDLSLVGKINAWLIKKKHPYLIQIKLSDKNGFGYGVQTKGEVFVWQHANTIKEAIMFTIDTLLLKIYKKSKSFIPKTIDPEQIQGEINREAFGD